MAKRRPAAEVSPETLYIRGRRDATRDLPIGTPRAEWNARIDLGLSLLSLAALPGVRYTLDEIAAWAGCTRDNILIIERRALKKVRELLQFRDRSLAGELREEYYNRRTPAVRKEAA